MLAYHVAEGVYRASALPAGLMAETIYSGTRHCTIGVDGENVTVNGATVTEANSRPATA